MAENVICPICKSEAEAINVGLFDGVGFRCKTHGEFEVADSALAMHKDTEATRWEAALRSAKDRAKATQAFVRRAVIYAVRASDDPRRAIEATEEGGPTAEEPRRGQSGDSPMAANC
jgi:hypothetical protein